MIFLAGVLAVVYLRAVARLAHRGRRWRPARVWAFLIGCSLIAVAGFTSDATFTGHMTEHLLLGMAAPFFLALGAPITLTLQTARKGTRRLVRRTLHSKVMAVVAHPIVGWVLFGGTLIAVYFTPLLGVAQRDPVVHVALHIHLVVVGSLFLWPLVGVDPTPRRLPFAARLLALLAAVPFHAFLGLALMSTKSLIAPQAYPSLADQHRAAAVLWASGEIFTFVVAMVVFQQWFAADQRLAVRLERRIFGEAGIDLRGGSDHVVDSSR
jgi:cytochrome c oxidase assembly factor CtaG